MSRSIPLFCSVGLHRWQSAGQLGLGAAPVDHVITQYVYDDVPICVAEGGWTMPGAYPFHMDFEAVGTAGTLVMGGGQLILYRADGTTATPAAGTKTGYEQEIEYFTNCIETGAKPDRVPAEQSKLSVEVVHAERKSAETGEAVTL